MNICSCWFQCSNIDEYCPETTLYLPNMIEVISLGMLSAYIIYAGWTNSIHTEKSDNFLDNYNFTDMIFVTTSDEFSQSS